MCKCTNEQISNHFKNKNNVHRLLAEVPSIRKLQTYCADEKV